MDASPPPEAGGLKEIQFKVKGDHVYSVMKFESGVHRVQRCPRPSPRGASTPPRPPWPCCRKADEVEVEINEGDLRIDVYRAGGPGGQCVNTTDSAVHHAPAHGPRGAVPGPKVAAAEQDRGHGRAAPRLYEKMLAEQQAAEAPERLAQIGSAYRATASREDPRTCPPRTTAPQDRVTDHRIGFNSTYNGASGRQPGGCDHGSAGGRPRKSWKLLFSLNLTARPGGDGTVLKQHSMAGLAKGCGFHGCH